MTIDEGQCPKCQRATHNLTSACPSCGYRAPSALRLSPISNKFDVIRRLGGGAMGDVFHVRHRLVPGMVRALKLIRAPYENDPAYVDRFRAEANVAQTIESPHVARLVDFDVCVDGTPFAVWEFVEGQTLAALIRARGTIEAHEAIALTLQIADGLTDIHRANVIHRDVKPSNIVIQTHGSLVKILDFGLAKPATDTSYQPDGNLKGTYRYMAPELFDTPPPNWDASHDVYAAGIVLYELLLGRPPFRATNDLALIAAIARDEPEWIGPLDPNAPHTSKLLGAVQKALAKSPARRYQNALELRSALEEALAEIELGSAGSTLTQLDPLAGTLHTITQVTPITEPVLSPPHHDMIVPAFDVFLEHLQNRGATVERRANEDLDSIKYRIPNFILFKRADLNIMAVVGGPDISVDVKALQKTYEPKSDATKLSTGDLRRLGFLENQVHPVFSDPGNRIHRIIVDAPILAQSTLFPDSMIVFPDGTTPTGKLIAPCYAAFSALQELHGDKLIYANISQRAHLRGGRWCGDPLLTAMLALHPLKTRFAPTPSGPLHLGNARSALAAYLLYRKYHKTLPDSRFHLRVDNTDVERSRTEYVTLIRNDLRALGIDIDRYESFQQGDHVRYAKYYGPILRILEMAAIIRHTEEGVALLPPRWTAHNNYYNFWFDWKDGPVVRHVPPIANEHAGKPKPRRRRGKRGLHRPSSNALAEKDVRLTRPRGRRPLYPFAGVVDDLLAFADTRPATGHFPRPVTYVVRDNRQRHLTEVQAHIRTAIEDARRALQGDPDAIEMLRDVGLDCDRPLPVPIYVHLPVVGRYDGAPLQKRVPHEEYLISSLVQQGVIPEAIVAYLAWTLTPDRTRGSLSDAARFVGQFGIECAIACFAEALDLAYVTAHSDKRLRCDLHALRRANFAAIGAMSPWTFRTRVIATCGEAAASHFEGLYKNRAALAHWNQVKSIADGPQTIHAVSSDTVHCLRRILASPAGRIPRVTIDAVLSEVRRLRLQARVTRRTDQAIATWKAAAVFLQDLRLLLTGSNDSPQIESLFNILGPSTVLHRISKVDEWTRT